MRNPYEDDFEHERDIYEREDEIEAEHFYPCACGDPECIADDRDKGNIKLGSAWYASDCQMIASHPEVIRARELDALWDGVRR